MNQTQHGFGEEKVYYFHWHVNQESHYLLPSSVMNKVKTSVPHLLAHYITTNSNSPQQSRKNIHLVLSSITQYCLKQMR